MRRNTLIDVEFVTLEHEIDTRLADANVEDDVLIARERLPRLPWRELSSGIRKNLTRISCFPEGAPIATDRGGPTVQPPFRGELNADN